MNKKWEILCKVKKNLPAGEAGITSIESVTEVLLKNRNIKNAEEFFNPASPLKIGLKDVGVNEKLIEKVINRLKTAKKNNQEIIIYGDYDADGICATAILWETLYKKKYKVLPYLPERFKEGYGINPKSVEKLKLENPKLKLIITVDNGIVAYDGIKKAKKLSIDVIVIDHHQKGDTVLATDLIIHSTKVCGSALSYFFSKEISKDVDMELSAIGTIADQMPLVGINRSIVKFGLDALKSTKRLGLKALMRESRIEKIGTYEVGFVIAPRLNATGRLTHAIDSLRLLCTRNFYKANELSLKLGKVNTKRQKIVTEVIISAEKKALDNKDKIIIISGKDYNEGVIGLAAGRITEKYYRPSIVLSINGETAKASARSISGFNIIKAIKATKLIIEGGGHPMAAGFSINAKDIEKFRKSINKIADKQLDEKILTPKVRIDMKLEFNQLNQELMEEIKKMQPFGMGNPQPVFVTEKVQVINSKKVGAEEKHLKLKLQKDGISFDAIWFNGSTVHSSRSTDHVNVVYSLDENTYNGSTTLQLKVKDLRVAIK